MPKLLVSIFRVSVEGLKFIILSADFLLNLPVCVSWFMAESVTGAVKPSFLYGMRKSASLLASSNIVIPVSVQFPPLNFGGWKVPSYMPSRLVPEIRFRIMFVCFLPFSRCSCGGVDPPG